MKVKSKKHKLMKRIILLFSLVLPFATMCQQKKDTEQKIVKVAAAANLRYVLEKIKKQYESEYPSSRIDISFGSSGTFTQQILNGADYDFFMAADMSYPKKIVENGYAYGDVETYIYGKLALWSLNLDVSEWSKSILSPQVKKIAIANPKGAPYGESTVKLLETQGLYKKISNKIVWGNDIGQTAQFAFSGNAELGFIALSLVFSPDLQGKGHFYVFPEDICPPQEQGCVLIKKSQEVTQFKNYIMSHKCDSLWVKFGYGLVKK
ncbi:MAG: molybdate ABC transporter substrate-binding protein [Candidatus Azobacteroides pseudotrichonymphae]|jgi:molybdate transport system substrate-binding protein|nr:molybdate ABC transporter substrate-binding protein [Bacteroidales bacterium OttesenSCG-928-I14]GMO36058.1 MAG: molybdate ABC transporter substrate-binding protein [Candidatus Azobacteroides pseudotrichonymphae]